MVMENLGRIRKKSTNKQIQSYIQLLDSSLGLGAISMHLSNGLAEIFL